MVNKEASCVPTYEVRRSFIEAVPVLLSQVDIFGEGFKIVKIGSSDFTLSTLDSDKTTVRNAYFMKEGEGFNLVDVEVLFNASERNVIKQGTFCQVDKKG